VAYLVANVRARVGFPNVRVSLGKDLFSLFHLARRLDVPACFGHIMHVVNVGELVNL